MIFINIILFGIYNILKIFKDETLYNNSNDDLINRAFILSTGVHALNFFNIISVLIYFCTSNNLSALNSILLIIFVYILFYLLYFKKGRDSIINSELKMNFMNLYVITISYVIISIVILFYFSEYIHDNPTSSPKSE